MRGNQYNPTGAQAFFEKHVVSTKLGLGDFRFQLAKGIRNTEDNQLYIGLELTLPSAVAFDGDRISLWLKILEFLVFLEANMASDAHAHH